MRFRDGLQLLSLTLVALRYTARLLACNGVKKAREVDVYIYARLAICLDVGGIPSSMNLGLLVTDVTSRTEPKPPEAQYFVGSKPLYSPNALQYVGLIVQFRCLLSTT